MSHNATIEFYDDGVTLKLHSQGRGSDQAVATILMLTGYNGRYRAVERLLSKAYGDMPQAKLDAFLKDMEI